MPGEGILSIGATVDKTGVDAGLGSIEEGFQSTVQTIAVQVEETCAKTKAAWNRLSEDVKSSAQTVSAESLRVAEATKAQTAALADLRRASTLAKDAKLDEAQSTSILAAAQVKATVAAAAVATAKKEEAAAVAKAAEEEALSQNVVIAAFQRAAISVRESLTEIQEKLVETAETGKLSAEGIASGFSALGSLLGAGLVVGFATHFMDETAAVDIELGHLHEKTGIAATSLAGLMGLVKESKGDWEAVANGLVKMNKSLADSTEPSKSLVNALGGIGLKIQELKGLSPEEKLAKIAVAMAESENSGNRAAAAIAVFGKGGAALIPILRSQGAELEHNIQLMQQQTGVTDNSIAESERWQRSVSNVARAFQRIGNVLVENVHYVEGALLAIYESISTAVQYVWATIKATALEIVKLGMTIDDIRSGRFWNLKQDWQDLQDSIRIPFKETTENIKKDWEVVFNLFKKPIPKPEAKAAETSDDGDGGGGGGGKGSKKEKAAAAARVAPTPQTQSPDMREANAEFLSGLREEARQAEENAKETAQAYREGAQEKIRIAQEEYAQVERTTEFEVRMGRMSPQQRIAALRTAADEEERIRLRQSQFLQLLDMGDIRKYEQDLRQEEQITRQHAQKIQQLNQQAALMTARSWQQAFDRMSDTFSRNTAMWMTGQQSLAQGWGKTLVGMTQTVITNLLQQAIAYATHAATVNAIDERQKLKDAAAAARKTYVAVAGIPYVGPFLAPAAAAAAFAAVEAFEQGGIVKGVGGGGVPILAHAGERVLTSQQTNNFEKLVNQSSSASTSITNHFHDESNYSAIDGASVHGMVRSHGREWRREMVRQMRLSNR